MAAVRCGAVPVRWRLRAAPGTATRLGGRTAGAIGWLHGSQGTAAVPARGQARAGSLVVLTVVALLLAGCTGPQAADPVLAGPRRRSPRPVRRVRQRRRRRAAPTPSGGVPGPSGEDGASGTASAEPPAGGHRCGVEDVCRLRPDGQLRTSAGLDRPIGAAGGRDASGRVEDRGEEARRDVYGRPADRPAGVVRRMPRRLAAALHGDQQRARVPGRLPPVAGKPPSRRGWCSE